MASLFEHAEVIKAAIAAAEVDGFHLEADIHYGRDGYVAKVELDLYHGREWEAIWAEDRDQ